MGGLLPNARRSSSAEGALTGKAITDDAVAAAARQVAADFGNDVSGDITRRRNTAVRSRPSSPGDARQRRGARLADLSGLCAHGVPSRGLVQMSISREYCAPYDVMAPSAGRLGIPASVDALQQAMAERQDIAGRGLAVSTYLALRLQRPLFLEGEPGVGKTEVARCSRPRSTPS